MGTNNQEPPWVDSDLFNKNQSELPRELFFEHADQYVAWSLDGTRLLAWGASPEEVWDKLDALGIPSSQYVQSYIYPPDVSIL